MADLQLRLHKDVLVMSASYDFALESQDFIEDSDKIYAAFCEPEIIEEQMKLETQIHIPCICLPTENITNARLAHASFEGKAEALAENCMELIEDLPVQHVIAPIYSTGLPIDETSKTSLKQSKKQYQDAVQVLMQHPIDAVYFEGFTNPYDAQCALMGARAVYDGVVILSYSINADGEFEQSDYTFENAVKMAEEYGADVIGVVSAAPVAKLETAVSTIKENTEAAILVQLIGDKTAVNSLNPQEITPYYTAQTMIDSALQLRQWGVQFMRPSGLVSPSYSGALLAAAVGRDAILS